MKHARETFACLCSRYFVLFRSTGMGILIKLLMLSVFAVENWRPLVGQELCCRRLFRFCPLTSSSILLHRIEYLFPLQLCRLLRYLMLSNQIEYLVLSR